MTVEVRGVSYPTLRAAAEAEGVSANTIQHRCHSSNYPEYRMVREPHRGAVTTPPPARERVPTAAPSPRPAAMVRVCAPMVEPDRWEFDGDMSRRVPVLDHNYDPPLVVRRVGWRRCLRCRRPMFSEDVVAIRSCWHCGGLGSDPHGRRLPGLEYQHDIRVQPYNPGSKGRADATR